MQPVSAIPVQLLSKIIAEDARYGIGVAFA